jgi:hypothetical protein
LPLLLLDIRQAPIDGLVHRLEPVVDRAVVIKGILRRLPLILLRRQVVFVRGERHGGVGPADLPPFARGDHAFALPSHAGAVERLVHGGEAERVLPVHHRIPVARIEPARVHASRVGRFGRCIVPRFRVHRLRIARGGPGIFDASAIRLRSAVPARGARIRSRTAVRARVARAAAEQNDRQPERQRCHGGNAPSAAVR